jgi:hypothetical protein
LDRTFTIALISVCLAFAPRAHGDDSSREAATPLSPILAPVAAPPALIVPGSLHWIRGESTERKALFTASGLSFITILGGAVGLAATGAASGVMIAVTPILLVAGSTFMAAGATDLLGSLAPNAPTPIVYDSTWGASYLSVPNPVFESQHYLRVEGLWRLQPVRLSASVTSDTQLSNLFLDTKADYPLIRWSESTVLYARGGILHERNPDSLFLATRLQSTAVFETQLSSVSPAFSGGSLQLSAGYLYRWTHYASELNSPDDFETNVGGGFRVGWQLSEPVRVHWGYEHARDELVGGMGMGYFGYFSGGLGYRATENDWVNARIYLGTPTAFQIGWESAW